MNIAIRTLQRYEYGQQVVPDETIWSMGKAYRDPSLPYKALKEDEVYKKLFPTYESPDAATATLGLIGRLNKLEDVSMELVDILQDGHIDPTERTRLPMIARKLKEVMAAGNEVLQHIDD